MRDHTAVFDAALSKAERHLQKLLADLTPSQIAREFRAHIDAHLVAELTGARKYRKSVARFRRAIKNGTESAV